MSKNNKKAGVWTIFAIVLVVIIIAGFFVPRNMFTETSSKKKNTFGQFSVKKDNAPTNYTPGPLKWKKSFVYEKEGNSGNKKQSYMNYMMEKNKK